MKYVSVLVFAGIAVTTGIVYSLPFQNEPSIPSPWFDSLNVRFVGNWPFAYPEDVACSYDSNFVFLGSGGGVYVMQIDTVGAPTKLHEKIHTRGLVRDMVCQDSLLYVACGSAGFEIWDVRNISEPVKIGACATPDYANEIRIADTVACIACRLAGLKFYNISDPSNPFEVGTFSPDQTIYCVAVRQSYAFVVGLDTTMWSSFYVVDFSDPANPYSVGSCSIYCCLPYGIVLKDTFAYIADGSVRIINIADLANPYELNNYTPPYAALKLAVSDNHQYLYVAAGWDAFKIIEISDPLNPIEYSTCFLFGGPALDVKLNSDSLACVPTRYSYLWMIGLTDHGAPNAIANFRTPRAAYDVEVSGDYLYRPPFWVVDIHDPLYPYEIGQYSELGGANEIAVDNDYAYLACNDSGLVILDISDPFMPERISTYPIPAAWGIKKLGNYVYLCCDNIGLCIFNVSNPYYPSWTGTYNSPGAARGVDVVDTFAYVADDWEGLRIVNVASPNAPFEVGHYDTPGVPWRVDVLGNYAYVADRSGGVRVIDVSNPALPFEAGFYSTTGAAYDVAVLDTFVHVAAMNAGLRVLNVADPENIEEVGYYVTPQTAWALTISGSYIYTACNEAGVQIYENMLLNIEEFKYTMRPASTFLLQNPVGKYIEMQAYSIPGEACRIYLYDPLGQLKKEFQMEAVNQTRFKLDIGDLPAGVYFLKLQVQERIYHAKVVKIK